MSLLVVVEAEQNELDAQVQSATAKYSGSKYRPTVARSQQLQKAAKEHVNGERRRRWKSRGSLPISIASFQ